MQMANIYALNLNRSEHSSNVVPNPPMRYTGRLTNKISNIAKLPENFNFKSEPTDINAKNDTLTSGKYFAILNDWAQQAPFPAMKKIREGMIDTLLSCLNNKSEILKIENSQLDSLPMLPPHIKKLSLFKVELTELPSLPAGLEELYCAHTTKLTSLPELPATLTSLSISNSPICRLPTPPNSLKHLNCSYTSLEQLPECPDGLVDARLMKNKLTTLPESFMKGVQGKIYVTKNPFSEETITQLNHLRDSDTHAGGGIEYSANGQDCTINTGHLMRKLATWLTGKDTDSEFRRHLALIPNDQNTQAFINFLDRLATNHNVKNSPKIKEQIAQWLVKLFVSPSLQKDTFDIAFDATATCDDRVSLVWNEMKKAELVDDVKCGRYDDKLPELINAGREMFRLEKLEKISRDHMNTHIKDNEIDEIEVYLAYQTKLRTRLKLTTVGQDMLYFYNAKLSQDDLQCAETQVKAAENAEMLTWLAQWEPMHSVIQRNDMELWNTGEIDIDKYDSQVSNELAIFIKKSHLDVSNSENQKAIADAEKDLGKKVYDEMNSELLKSVTLEYLSKQHYEKPINNYWDI